MNTRLQVQRKTTQKSSFIPGGRNLLTHSSTEQAEPPLVPPILHDMLPAFQAKLKIGKPNDKYEQEADRVADQVMRMPEPKIQRVCPKCEEELQRQPLEDEEEEETLQTKPLAEQITPLVQRQAEPMEDEEEEETLQAKTTSGQPPTVSSNFQNRITALQGGGQPLPHSERAFFEPRFGVDFSQVRVHKDSQAAETASAVNARAFTVGRDIVFGAGQYQPNLSEGQRLLAHELSHIVQQNKRNLMSESCQLITTTTVSKITLQRKIFVKPETELPLSSTFIRSLTPEKRRKVTKMQARKREEKGFVSYINGLLQDGINRSATFKAVYTKLHLDKKNRTLTIKPSATNWGGDINRMAFDPKVNTVIVDMLKIKNYDKVFDGDRDDHIVALFHELDHAHQFWFRRKQWDASRIEREKIIKEKGGRKKLTMSQIHDLDPEEQRAKNKAKIVAKELRKNRNPKEIIITIGPEFDALLEEVKSLKKRFEKARELEKERAYMRALMAYKLLKEIYRKEKEILKEGKEESLKRFKHKFHEFGDRLERIWK